MARRPELEVAFAADKPLVGRPARRARRARLPEPPRKPNPREAAILRGLADSMALRLACHNEASIAAMRRRTRRRARCSTRSSRRGSRRSASRRMEGVASNLTAMLDDRYHRAPYSEARERDEAPLEDAVAMMVRERLTGLEPPAAPARVVDLWRPYVEDKAARRARRLDASILDQRAFARSVHRLLASLDMAERLATPTRTRKRKSGDEIRRPSDADDADGEGEEEQSRRHDGDGGVGGFGRRTRGRRDGGGRRAVGRIPRRGGRPAKPTRRPRTASPPSGGERRGPDYKAYTTSFDEVVDAEELCDAEELQRLRAYLDKQLQNLSNVVARLANRLQRRLMAQQNRTWEFDLEEGMLDVARLTRVIIDPAAPLSFKRKRTPSSATRWSRC